MANRRMFSKTIIDSDEFIEMPPTARLLYFDLGMRADDDGFVQPQRIVKMTSSSPDDLKILLAKSFIISFEDGKVFVIADWKIHNNIRTDRYTETIYKEYKRMLFLDENKRYLKENNNVIPNVIPAGDTGKDRLGKVSIVKDSIIPKGIRAKAQPREDINELLKKLKKLLGVLDGSKLEQRRTAKNFLDSKTPEILKCAGNLNPNREQIINATLRIFQLATQDDFHRKNANSMRYVYNKAAAIVQSQKNNKPQVGVIS